MTYAKGVHYERSLMKFLATRGFSTLRVAGSGHNSPADIVAIKSSRVLAIECKAHANKPRIKQEKVMEMKEWCEKAGALGFLAWRAPKKDWLFLPIESLELGRYEDEHWIDTESLLRALMVDVPASWKRT